MTYALEIHHDLGDVSVKPVAGVNRARLKKMIRATLDQYQDEELVPAQIIHDEARLRHGDYYRTPGYYLRVYRHRADLTQTQLAEQAGIHQHHLSEMENNKRSIGKTIARKLAKILNFDYRRLL